MKNFKIISVTALLLLFAVLFGALASCNDRLYSEGQGELNIVASNFPPFEFSRVVAGEKATVTILQDNGADLHNYSPTTATLTALSNADIFVCVGGDSDEKWINDAIENCNNPSLKVIKLADICSLTYAELEAHNHSEYCEANHEHDHDHDHDHEDDGHGDSCGDDCTEDHDHDHDHEGDEHVWTSLRNAIKIVSAIADACCEKDAANADFYKANSASYIASLQALDAEYEAAVNASATKTLVFADRFPFIYMTNDYGICYYAAFSGCSSDVNASFETQTKLSEALKHNSLPAVIIIENSDGSLAQTVVNGTDAKILTLNSMQSVTRAQIQEGISYLQTMKNNLEILKEALK